MAEQMKTYFQFYNVEEDFFSRPKTRQQVMDEIEVSLNTIPKHGYIVYNINKVFISDTQMAEGIYDNAIQARSN